MLRQRLFHFHTKKMICQGDFYMLLLLSKTEGLKSSQSSGLQYPLLQQSDDLTNRLCGVSRTSSGRTTSTNTCLIKDMGTDVLVLLVTVARRKMADCQNLHDSRRPWTGILWCVFLIASLFRFEKLQKSLHTVESLHAVRRMVKELQSPNATLQHSSNIIEKCDLKQVSSQVYCGYSNGPFSCQLLVTSKTLLFLLSYPPRRNQTSMEIGQTSFGCWESEL